MIQFGLPFDLSDLADLGARLRGRALTRSGGEAQIGRKDPTTVAAGASGDGFYTSPPPALSSGRGFSFRRTRDDNGRPCGPGAGGR